MTSMRWPRLAHKYIAISILAVSVPCVTGESLERVQVSLSGEWEFRIDPKDDGKGQRWFDAQTSFPRRVIVPGAWNAQGIGFESEADLRAYRPNVQKSAIAGPGFETNRLFHTYPGPAWYRRT